MCRNAKTLFLTHHNLQGSQTEKVSLRCLSKFLTHHNLQGSQTLSFLQAQTLCFLPIIIYKVLKLYYHIYYLTFRFLPIIIYKVLKQHQTILKIWMSFLPIIIYKVLKPSLYSLIGNLVSYPS